MKEIYEQIKQEGIDISKIVQKKATKLKNKLVADPPPHKSHKRQEVLEDLLQISCVADSGELSVINYILDDDNNDTWEEAAIVFANAINTVQ